MMTEHDINRVIRNARDHAKYLSNEAKEMERWPFMGPLALAWRASAAMWIAFAERLEGTPPSTPPHDTSKGDR